MMFRRFIISIELAIKNLRVSSGRTILTLVGIIVGITAVIVVSSSGQGVKEYILGQFNSYGSNLIQIEPKVPSTGKTSAANATGQAQGISITTLKISDAEAIKKIPNVKDYVAGTIAQEIFSYQNVNKRVMIYATGANWPDVDTATKVAEGTFYSEAEDNSLAQVVVIGVDLKNALFGSDDAIGKYIKIKGMQYRVIGVLEKRGMVTFINYDDLAYIPVQTVQKKILGVDYLKFISVLVKDSNMIDATAADIADILKRQHKTYKPDQEDYAITTMQEAQKMIEDVFKTINILLLALTSISLVVGGVGIMNVMYVAVVERTFEIGLRKAVGAKASDIKNQFLLEAVIITLIGGLIGIVLGYVMAFLFSYLISLAGFSLKFSVTANSILLATGFSTMTGIIFGYYPAYKASKLSPMEALRKE